MKNLSLNSFQNDRNNNPFLPKSIRACIIGKSGCGKTNLLMNLLLDSYDGHEWLDYDHLYIYGKSLHQKEYRLLNKCFSFYNTKKEVMNCFEKKKDPIDKRFSSKQKISIELYEKGDEIKDPSEYNIEHKNLIIFDDVIGEKQNVIESFYTRGRHNNIDCFYISQNYFKLPRQTIRENANLFIIFEQDGKNKNHIYQDHCTDISKNDFDLLCKTAWNEKYGYVVVDLTKSKLEGKYRKGFNDYFFPKN